MDVQQLLLFFPVLLFSVVAHEYAHGYAALRQGDPTAYQLGRLTFNPVKHIDPFMTILLPLVLWYASSGQMLFGGAKPVPVNPRNYRNYKRGDIIVSLAGVATNFVLAFVAAGIFALLYGIGKIIPAASGALAVLQQMMALGVILNLVLIAFNLLPIPPLDGSHVMKYLLPPAWSMQYQQIGGYGLIILIVLIYVTPGFLNWWMGPASFLAGVILTAVAPLQIPPGGLP